MDLILDAGGAFAWSRGPTTAPILSIAAKRLTVEPPHTVGAGGPGAPATRRPMPPPPRSPGLSIRGSLAL